MRKKTNKNYSIEVRTPETALLNALIFFYSKLLIKVLIKQLN